MSAILNARADRSTPGDSIQYQKRRLLEYRVYEEWGHKMDIGHRLNAVLGKDINNICQFGFHDPGQNHCAHLVSHICDLNFTYDCRQITSGKPGGGNVRVHEIFKRCPKVGKWQDADLTKTQLVFVTRKQHVDLNKPEMLNHPQKHIGVYYQGQVYHYSNVSDKVVRESPDSFLNKFQALYEGDQGLFFGHIPGDHLGLKVSMSGADVSSTNKFALMKRPDGWWDAAMNGEAAFPVAKEVNRPADGYHGLFVPFAQYYGPIYRHQDYVSQIDHWAVLLEVTGACESENRFALVNTYDRAKFTFGFYQLAAHTPKDNLILLFKRLALLPAFKRYFPELGVRNGRLHRIDSDGAATDLEQEFKATNGEMQIMHFMNYLNPRRFELDEQEVLHAARLVAWAIRDPEMRRAQVIMAAEILQKKFSSRYAPKLNLDGQSDTVCAIVGDIFHHGRGSIATVRAALNESNPVEALLTLNPNYKSRNDRLRRAIERALADELLGHKRYQASSNGFVA